MIMLDLETLSDEFIVQIGASYFSEDGIGENFIANISMFDNVNRGFKIDAGNVKFWIENAEKVTWLKGGLSITKALHMLKEFCNKNKKAPVWSHYYDMHVIDNVCKKLGQRVPFHYKRWRDINTLVYLSKIKIDKKIEKEHNALADCYRQIEYVRECLRKVK